MADSGSPRRIRVLRIIARMNVGGPAFHVSILSGRLDPRRYETLLLTGALGAGEGSLEWLTERYDADYRVVAGMGPELRPADDLRALRALVRIMRAWKPDIVHTHTAKAGTLGRLAARIALGRRVIIVHTYHGHVLRGYFEPAKNAAFRTIERALGRMSDCLIGVSQATVDDLVALRVAPASRFVVVPIGLDLDAFLAVGPPTNAGRVRLGAHLGDVVVTFVGRLVPIKRVDVLLNAVELAREQGAGIHLAVVGDGELRPQLEAQAAHGALAGHVTFLGFRDDLAGVARGTDVAVLTSDNEGTPVALIEAAAAGRPSIATAVGGVRDIVRPDTGITVPAGDVAGLASAMVAAAQDADWRTRSGEAARAHVRESYSAERLIGDIDRLYAGLLYRARY